MKLTCFAVLAVLVGSAAAVDKPCIALISTSDRPELVREALSTAVTLSGDFDFYSSKHSGCWTVREVSFATKGVKGYAIGWVVTDPIDRYIQHGIQLGQEDIFDIAMRDAAAIAIKDIRAVTSH